MFLTDLRYALRRLAQSPGYCAMAVLALALGIGANANVFSFVNTYLLNPLPLVKEIDRIAVFEARYRGSRTGISYLDYLDYTGEKRAFESLTAVRQVMPVLTGRGEPERVLGAEVSSSYFPLFGAQPWLGRAFADSELYEPVLVVSYRFWQKRFGGSPDAIGQSMALNNVSYRIIGIMPPRFRSEWADYDFWRPLSAEVLNSPRSRRYITVFGRLKPGAEFAAAQQEINTVAGRLEKQYPDTNAEVRTEVRPFLERIGEGPRESIAIMVYVVGFVLLIACANVTNLQLARATGRASEIAIRVAMGASRWRIVRQVLIESAVVALAGGALGLALSHAGAKFLITHIPPQYQPLNQTLLDGRIVLFTAAVALLTGIVSGLAPAFQVSHVNVNEVLKEGGRGNTGGSKGRLRNALVVVEVTLALVLLLGAGLLIQSFVNLQDLSPGFRTDRLLVASIDLPEAKYPGNEQRINFFHNLTTRVAAIPGVRAAAATTGLPLYSGSSSSFVVEGQPTPPAGSETFAGNRQISPGYLQTLGIPLRAGRYFTDQDVENSLRVAIVNERMAQQFFPKGDAIGKRIKWGRNAQSSAPWMTIVGVASDVKRWSMTAPPTPEVYSPFRQDPRVWSTIVIRTDSADPGVVAPALRAEVRALDPDQPITDLRTMQNIVYESMTIQRLMSALMAVFAGIALAMAAMGIYGVISYSVAQRTHEFGIRMALGAGSPTVVRLVLRQAVWVLGIAVGIGVPAALATTRVLQSYLYGVGARDPVTFVAIPLTLVAVGVLASYIPAVRATRVDPVVALRCE
jgi:putative ABC transport system permease protein